VCEVRVPGRGGCRLWLGTYGAAEAAARAHDAAMLGLRGACGAAARRLNFADSAWLLDVPAHAALRGAEGGILRRAVARAVEEFLRTRPAAEDAMSATSEPPPAAEDDDDASSDKSDDGTASPFKMDDVLSDMGGQLELALRRWQRTAVRASVRSGSTPPTPTGSGSYNAGRGRRLALEHELLP